VHVYPAQLAKKAFPLEPSLAHTEKEGETCCLHVLLVKHHTLPNIAINSKDLWMLETNYVVEYVWFLQLLSMTTLYSCS